MKSFLSKYPFFVFLLPVFFVFHIYAENFNYSLTKEAIELSAIYMFASLVLAGLFFLLLRNFYKASLVTVFLMAFNFFFGSIYDFLKNYLGNSILLKYSVILPGFLVLLLLLIIYLRKTKRNFQRFGLFLNGLLLGLILLDFVIFLPDFLTAKELHAPDMSKQFTKCDNCVKPDIYLILADEYAGKEELKELFSFDNTAFENQLKERQFHIINNTKSNYNATVYSMASLFSMNYISKLEKNIVNHRDMFICRNLIKANNLTSFFSDNGYELCNFSPFNFADTKTFVTSNFFISKKEIFVSQTFTGRFLAAIGYHFATEKKLKSSKDLPLFNINKIDSATRRVVQEENNRPKFVYTHLNLPHFPYYYDSTGRSAIYNSVTHTYPEGKKEYIQYLVYANKRLLSLIDYIKSASKNPPIIILMSDHGYRAVNEVVDQKYYFMNLNAVYLPDGNYTGFYDSMSNVNQFRVLLNSQFGQKLPLLKDSTSFLIE